MPVFFQDLNDYLDLSLYKRAMQQARRASKGKLFYVPQSKAVGGPALIMTTGRIDPDLQRVLKAGGTKVGGTFENRPDGRLILWPKREVNRAVMAADVRALLLSCGVVVQLHEIHIRTPADIKRRAQRKKNARNATKTQASPTLISGGES